jgi:DNA (cytosine-5)-methyltransferase 1
MDKQFDLLRVAAGYDIKKAAESLGVTTATIRNWERDGTKPRIADWEHLKRESEGYRRSRPSPQASDFTFIDLFAGIGGMRTGFEAAGGKCIFTSEWNKYALQTYVRNFGYDHPIVGDITKVNVKDIPSHDVLLAGFPCQPFSIAGVSKKNSLGRKHGFECTTQGTLFFEIERILAWHRPAAFLLENVKNLKSHDKGLTFAVIMETLEKKLGYRVRTKIIDGCAWTPQHRERIFIVGFRNDVPFEFDQVEIPTEGDHPKLDAVLHREDGSEEPEEPYTTKQGLVNPKYNLTDHLWNYLQEYAARHKAKGNGFGYGLVGRDDIARTLSARYYKDGAEVLVNRGTGKTPRRLTPRECARLMGFDRPDLPRFEIPISDTQAYKQFGNAVVTQAVEAVAKAMRPHILSTIEKDKDIRMAASA